MPPAPQGDAALLAQHGRTLLALARESIDWRARMGSLVGIDPAEFPPALRSSRAAFVTLTQSGQLRGCVGSSIAWRSLVEDVVENAAAAAFEDRRFAPLAAQEVETLDISISLLSTPIRLEAESEAALLSALRPGLDGLILRQSHHHALFLPAVWEHLPEPAAFLRQLKLKAGLPQDHWSPALEFHRFETASVSDAASSLSGPARR